MREKQINREIGTLWLVKNQWILAIIRSTFIISSDSNSDYSIFVVIL